VYKNRAAGLLDLLALGCQNDKWLAIKVSLVTT